MRKEVILAIVIGIILGTVILFGIRLANKSVSPEPVDQTDSISPTPATSLLRSLSIVTPVNHSVTEEKTITLTGTADPGSTLAVVTEEDDLLLQASTEGTFSARINLVSGENNITVTQVLKDLKTASETVTVIQTNNLPE